MRLQLSEIAYTWYGIDCGDMRCLERDMEKYFCMLMKSCPPPDYINLGYPLGYKVFFGVGNYLDPKSIADVAQLDKDFDVGEITFDLEHLTGVQDIVLTIPGDKKLQSAEWIGTNGLVGDASYVLNLNSHRVRVPGSDKFYTVYRLPQQILDDVASLKTTFS